MRGLTIGVMLLVACSDDATDRRDATREVTAPRAQCEPCRADPGCPDGARCLDYLGLGAFCGDECSDTVPCPTGYLCAEVDTLAGQGVRACVHASGMCPCTPEVAARGEPSVCVTPSDWGSCRGESLCDGSAWSACEGPIAAPDLPNGLDDDCDGQTDENICSCGDGNCNLACGETLVSCPCDCAARGDGVCSPCGESPLTAPEDCCRSTSGSSDCGDGVCMGYGCGEDPDSCPSDCGTACGNLVCDQGESPYTCREDCLHKVCGNHICESTDGGPDECPQDCSAFCGDCICDALRDESQFNCPIDCGYCGDRDCSRCAVLKESPTLCAEDCCERGATCLVEGSCNIGRYACEGDDTCELTAELWPRGVECGPAQCEDGALRLQSRCDDEGQCQPGVLLPCVGFQCRDGACLTTCDGPEDCADGHACIGLTCAPLRSDGAGCGFDAQCASTFCEDGICCHTACEADAGDVCGPSGDCSSGACRFGALGTPCGGGGCVDGQLADSFACDGEGECVGDDPSPCPGNLACADADTCREGCDEDAHCVSGFGCVDGACEPLVPDGAPCVDDARCASGQCEGNVCCDVACEGACRSCTTAGQVGTCVDLEAGTGCGGGGCQDGVLAATFACDGDGACIGEAATPCPGHLACRDADACRESCTEDAHCVAGYGCEAGACEPLTPDGQGCDGPADCLNGHCEDGVCCATACGGTCKSCAVAGHLGACRFVPAGEDPGEECQSQLDDPCGLTGQCDGAGQCALGEAGTECRAPTCAEDLFTPGASCDGDGDCDGAATGPCPGHFACQADGQRCYDACTSDAHCATGTLCNVPLMLCEPPRPDGAECDLAAQCLNGYCEDGVCCDNACETECMSCRVEGKRGTCTLVPEGEDPDEECLATPGVCGLTGLCDGAGACDDGDGATCGAPGCRDGVLGIAFTCAEGECVPASPLPCEGHLACASETQCLASCAMDVDCVGGWVCNPMTGQCVEPGSDGAPCGEDGDCASDNCQDQICCAAGCDGVCEVCAMDGRCELLDQQQVAQCMDALWCVRGECEPRGKPDGEPCTSDGECLSAACSDGVCCDVDCDGIICKDCSLFGSVGTCTTVRGDVEDDCTATGGVVVDSPCIGGNCTTWCDDAGECVERNGTVNTCFTDAECPRAAWCSASLCVDDLPTGSLCSRAAQCLSNVCVGTCL